jgi:hypothetical protein
MQSKLSKTIAFILLTAVLIFATPLAVEAQTNRVAILEYFDDGTELEITDSNGFTVNYYLGIALNPGDVVITGNTSAELRLDPNGSIVKVAPQTRLTIDGIGGSDGSEPTAFGMERGRMRMIAARITGVENTYSVRTPTAVAGVRGTDFLLTIAPPDQPPVEELAVLSGEVAFESLDTGESILVGAGQRANALAEQLVSEVIPPEELATLQTETAFVELDPEAVPGQVEEAPPEPEPEPAPQPVPAPAPEPDPPEPEARDGGFIGTLLGASSMEVGSITINEETWAQAAFQPRIAVGRLALELYLPITYRDDLFDAGSWYRPEGNNEWSFGSDQDWSGDPAEAIADVATDLALKIKSLEYGSQGDPFFVKLGNISTFTVGQGLLMRNYANDVDFPTVRRVGFNLGIDREKWGFEAMVNDLAAPEIYGGRMYFSPAAPVVPAAVGITGITDIAPTSATRQLAAGETADGAEEELVFAAETADPLFLSVAMDISLPVLDREILSMIAYAEGGGLIPFLREDTTVGAETVNAGLKTDALVDFSTGELRNFGWSAGVRGNVTILDYLLEFRSFDGIFRPGFYGPAYDRLRGTYAAETVLYLANSEDEAYKRRTLGVAGEAGASIFGLVDLAAGYFWPWEITNEGSWRGSDQDEFLVSVDLQEGLIPFGIETGLEYRRTHFAATIGGWGQYADAQLFDANTTLDGYVAYPFNEFVRLVAQVSTAAVRDENGEIVYDDNGNPRMAPTVAIQTQIGF